MVVCNNCGAELNGDFLFCPKCGDNQKPKAELMEKKKSSIENPHSIRNHLKIVKLLEVRKYTLEQLIEQLDLKIRYLKTKKDVNRHYPKSPPYHLGTYAYLVGFTLFFILGAFSRGNPLVDITMMVTIIPMLLSDHFWACFGISLVVAIVGHILWILVCFIADLINRSHEKKQYHEQVKKRDKFYLQDLKKVEILEKEKAELIKEKNKTSEYLDKVYSVDIIYPKYRNLVAVVTMYEYFVSGRCESLVGHEGAYNLYENELRQNIIICSLGDIMRSLEQIKQNQYILYQAIRETQSLVDDLSYAFDELSSNAEEIKTNSKIAAYNSKIAAENSEIAIYMSLIN